MIGSSHNVLVLSLMCNVYVYSLAVGHFGAPWTRTVFNVPELSRRRVWTPRGAFVSPQTRCTCWTRRRWWGSPSPPSWSAPCWPEPCGSSTHTQVGALPAAPPPPPPPTRPLCINEKDKTQEECPSVPLPATCLLGMPNILLLTEAGSQ